MSIARNQLRIVRELWSRLQPLDRALPGRLQTLLADRRFGSRDRRLYRELLLTALRQARALPAPPADDETAWAARLARTCAATRETEAFRAAFASDHATAEPASPAPLELLPDWFSEEVETAPGQPAPSELAAALLDRAPVWVRQQTDTPDEMLAEWAARGWTAEPHPTLPEAWKLPPETPLSSCPAYQAGHYEIQDLGSQLILASLDLPARSPGPRWLDACAGAGGKTLQLARLLGPSARIDAADPRAAALAELRARAARAGLAARIRTMPAPRSPAAPADAASLPAAYDGVLVDAPCTGGGTWRRAPHLMACTGRADIAAAAALQLRILSGAAARVRAGGVLVYATCSVFRRENEDVAAAFLASAEGAGFRSLPPALDHGFPRLAHGLSIVPGRADNDGFYVAAFRRA